MVLGPPQGRLCLLSELLHFSLPWQFCSPLENGSMLYFKLNNHDASRHQWNDARMWCWILQDAAKSLGRSDWKAASSSHDRYVLVLNHVGLYLFPHLLCNDVLLNIMSDLFSF